LCSGHDRWTVTPRSLDAPAAVLEDAKVRLCSLTDQLDTRTGAALLSILRVFADHKPTPNG
jgi:hypothetical protein